MKLSEVNLTLFFTGSVSLRHWVEVGNLSREIAVYEALTEDLNAVNFVTYGGDEDKKYSSQLGSIGCHPIPWSHHKTANITRLLLRHWSFLNKSVVLKTNQIIGCEVPIRIKKIFRKKLIVRCGYLLSRAAVKSGGEIADITYAHKLEKFAFRNADIGVVTTEFSRHYIIEKYGISPDKIVVIPNYVDTEQFRLINNVDKEYDIVFVGRAGEQKNLKTLFKSLAILKEKGQNINLLLVGGCSSDIELKDLAKSMELKVVFYGNVRNDLLPDIINKGKLFILPSIWEGHPKALIEAMSCGMPCIGTAVEGIKEMIKNGETGYLCGTDADSIANAIDTVLSDEALKKKMGTNARQYVVDNFSLDRVIKMELDVLKRVINL
ncbi:glycosyltransferase family 4 protein [Acidobacteriota bacterium]